MEFSEEVMANKCMKKCSTPFAIKDMQIKTALRFHLTPVQLAITKKMSTKCGRGCGERNPQPLLVGMQTSEPLWRSGWRFLKN
jgi:hypothetical protein